MAVPAKPISAAVATPRPGNELQGEAGNRQGVAGNNAYAAANNLGGPISYAAAPPNYGAAFQNALAGARGNIQAQLGAALGDIASSQAAAGQALGQLPGGVNAAYDQQQHTVDSALSAIQGAQAKSGIGSLMPVSAFMQPEMAAVQGSRQAALANVPLLQVGIGEEGARQRAAAQMAAQNDTQQLNMQQAGFDQSQQSALQNYQYQQQLQNSEDAARLKETNAQKTGTPVIDPKTGLPKGYTQQDVLTAQKSPQYQRSMNLLTSADPADQPRIWADMQRLYATNPALLAALAAASPAK